jgi:hypothetical protein
MRLSENFTALDADAQELTAVLFSGKIVSLVLKENAPAKVAESIDDSFSVQQLEREVKQLEDALSTAKQHAKQNNVILRIPEVNSKVLLIIDYCFR